MITIIYDEKGKDMSLQASGHAGYAPKGQDIVCAAVSTLMQSLAYSVDSGTVTCDPGGDKILRVQANRSLDTLAKFELVIDGLYLLAQQYPCLLYTSRCGRRACRSRCSGRCWRAWKKNLTFTAWRMQRMPGT